MSTIPGAGLDYLKVIIIGYIYAHFSEIISQYSPITVSLFTNLLASLAGGSLFKNITVSLHDHVQRDDSLNADLPTIPLSVIQQTTNHFSGSSKLGEGGFGPVYKVLMNWIWKPS